MQPLVARREILPLSVVAILNRPFGLPSVPNIFPSIPSKCLTVFHTSEATPMAICKRCALNGRNRNGGPLGICKMHARTKCQICGAASLGAELCTAHAHQEELQRWEARSQFRIVDPDAQLDLAEIRREKLIAAKFLAHQAVEEFFRALLQVMQALYGQPASEPPADEKKKAA